MANGFRYYNVNQDLLLPPSLREWLPEGHLAYFISDTVCIDLSKGILGQRTENFQKISRRDRLELGGVGKEIGI